MAKKKVCVKKDKLGDCIEWKEVGQRIEANFREEDKTCNPELYEKFKEKFVKREIDVRL